MSFAIDHEVEAAKALVWSLWADVDGVERCAGPRDLSLLAPDVEAWVSAPVGRLSGAEAVGASLFEPLLRSFPQLTRRTDVFGGGRFDGGVWVASTGVFRGQFREDWCTVPAHGGEVDVRFGEFAKVVDERIVEVRILFDVVWVAAQASHELLPPFSGRSGTPPPPALANGVSRDAQDPAVSAETLQLIEDMLGGCNRLVDGELRSMGMDAYWHTDMRWYGPHGVGAAHGFDEFGLHAQGPSVASFPNRRGGFHQARFADGLMGAFTGWPSLQGTFDGVPFRGIEPTGGPIGQNIMDFYVRRGDLLHENWVLIDLVDFAAQCGVDLLERFR